MRGFRLLSNSFALGIATSSLPALHAAAPAPRADAAAILAGGCFWGTEAVYEHLKGVRSVTSGFANAPAGTPVAVEAVRIVYDPAIISYWQLLEVFFAVAHDPTSRDRQGPDAGAEYRAVVFYQTDQERDAAGAYLAELVKGKRFAKPIVTEVLSLAKFTVAPSFHQDYGFQHPDEPYIVQNDAPKLVHLKRDFPALYQERRAP